MELSSSCDGYSNFDECSSFGGDTSFDRNEEESFYPKEKFQSKNNFKMVKSHFISPKKIGGLKNTTECKHKELVSGQL